MSSNTHNTIAAAFGSATQGRWFNSSVANRRIRAVARNETNGKSLLKRISIPRSSDSVEEAIAMALDKPEVLDPYRFEWIKWNMKSQQPANVDWAAWELELAARAYAAQWTAEQQRPLLEQLATPDPAPVQEEAPEEEAYEAPDLSDLRFCHTKITKRKKEFLPKIEATSTRFNGFFAHLCLCKPEDSISNAEVAALNIWRDEFTHLYANFEQGLRIVDKLTDDDFDEIKNSLNALKYVKLKKLTQKERMKEIVVELLKKKISFKYWTYETPKPVSK